MRTIRIESMTLINFKGTARRTITFGGDVTEIAGRNASGKTTIFDAFTWLLFGKDSSDRKQFEIKTVGADGNAVQRLPHEVSAVLSVDGERVELRRCLVEKWTKPKGAEAEAFTGNTTEYYWNSVPCSAGEYAAKVAEICPEDTFKYITSPAHFCSQKPDTQRAMLLRMAGDISDDDIAAGNPDFTGLLLQCRHGGKTIDEYRREIQAQKRKVREECDSIPQRIDERERDSAAYSATDYDAIRKQIEERKAELAEVEGQLTDASERAKAQTEAHREHLRKVNALVERRSQREFEIQREVTAEYRKRFSELTSLKAAISHAETRLRIVGERVALRKEELSALSEQRAALVAEWKAINAERITVDLTCPLCHRPLDPEQAEQKQERLIAEFNRDKASRLAANCGKGKAIRAKMDEKTAAIEADGKIMEDLRLALGEMRERPLLKEELTEPSADAAIAADQTLKEIDAETERVKAEAPTLDGGDTSGLRIRRDEILKEIDTLRMSLYGESVIEKNAARIDELKTQLRACSQRLAELEREEWVIGEFRKARTQRVSESVDRLFQFVRFRMFATQVNGEEVETCEATVGGVPYSVLNNAMRINAGLDIINAISKHEGISAPVFIDNAESVIALTETGSQQVRLIVADTDLTVR